MATINRRPIIVFLSIIYLSIFILYVQNLFANKVAKVMKKSKRQVENLIYRAKRALKTELDKEGFIYEEL